MDDERQATNEEAKQHQWGEPAPKPNEREAVWDLVIKDMQARDRFGRAKYGTPLQAFNGRNALKDLYEEELDKIVYLRQLLEEEAVDRPLGEACLPPVLRISAQDLSQLLNENERLAARVNELLVSNSRLVEERREVDINQQVREFFVIAGQAIGDRPHIPTQDITRFRLRLVTEEFIELLKATFGEADLLLSIERDLQTLVDRARLDLHLPDIADACADLDYVVAGIRVAFGIDGRPIMLAVHTANMAKAGGPIRPSDGKRMKPEGWTPPDIKAELVKQGWDPCIKCFQRTAEIGGYCFECDADEYGDRAKLDEVRNLPRVPEQGGA